MNEAQGGTTQDKRPPRGALIVVAVGLVACVVAALAATGKGEGEAAPLEWVQAGEGPDSGVVSIPGGNGEMRLTDTRIRATGTNFSGYSLFIVGTRLTVSAGSLIADGRVLCAVKARKGTEIGQSGGDLRGTYPRSSDAGIYSQEVPDTVLMQFSARGAEMASLEVPDRPQSFTTEKGVKLEWPEYRVGEERLKYLITGNPKQELVLPFFTVWKTTDIPSAKLRCTLETSAGTSTVRTEVALAKRSPPIDEEAEEQKAQERDEREEEEGEGG
ncbi:MAG TPA: hypothetical protein VFM51_03860 [Solirubrobacterales bacterium]|nr:hypothetical protein [Solirubrobacterales bacterium]